MTLARSFSLALFALVALEGAAAAQPDMSRALSRSAFEEGMKLARAGSYPAACARLEESLRLEAQMGTRFWLADCYEHLGKSASAWSNFLTVASEAEASGNPTRAATARKRADALAAALPRLSVVVAEAARATPGLEIRRDEAVLGPLLWGTPVPVDVGAHTIRATAPGRQGWEVTLDVNASGGRVEVPPLREIPAAPAPLPPPPPAPLPPPPIAPVLLPHPPPAPLPPPAQPWRRPTVVATGSIGLAGVVVGGVFGGLALTSWHGAEALCTPHCSPAAPGREATATTYATVSDVGFALAGAGLGTALVVWLTTPSRAAPAVGVAPAVGGLVLGGTFQ